MLIFLKTNIKITHTKRKKTMKKVILFSLFLITGLVCSQTLPHIFGEGYQTVNEDLKILMFICLSFIMINVGREFKLDKTKWNSYVSDYFIAMLTAAAPWIMVTLYFMFILPSDYMGNWDAWKENLLLGRFAAPTSAGILFTMLAAAGLKKMWIYTKTQTLAIFDDLDTIILMIPLQIMMIGMKWQLFVILAFVFGLLAFGWKKLGHYKLNQSAGMIMLYSIFIVIICNGTYFATKTIFGEDGGIHLEVLLPAFVLGMVMKTTTHYSQSNELPGVTKFRLRALKIVRKMTNSTNEEDFNDVANVISYLFMFLVGISTPLFINAEISTDIGSSITASQPMMSTGTILMHVLFITIISNIGKMFPILFYRDRHILERLALSIGMFTRGEVGAGIIIIALGYKLGGPALIIAILSLVLNLILTGGFVLIVKNLAQRVYGKDALTPQE